MLTNEVINSLPWIEKYRPKKIEHVTLDVHIKKQICQMIENRDFPNIIMEGPPGVGKTSTIRCMAREIYGKYYKDMVLEMNASDDRGIRIQESITNFRRSYVKVDPKDNIAKFKLVILDEADNMTDKAKYIISGFLKTTINDIRFAFTCNTKMNILSSIQSACYIIKYPTLIDKIIFDRLNLICQLEGVIDNNTPKKKLTETSKGLKAICEITNGDLRHSLNILQLTYNRFGYISDEAVYKIHDKPHPEKSKEIIECCYNNDLPGALQKIMNMRNIGYSGTDIALGLSLALRLSVCNHIPEETKIKYLQDISYNLYNISKGLDSSLLQVSACVADMCQSNNSNK